MIAVIILIVLVAILSVYSAFGTYQNQQDIKALVDVTKGIGINAKHIYQIFEMLKEQEAVKCPTDHDNELTRHVLFTARQHVEECLNKAMVRYGGETAEYLMFAKGIRDACWAIDELINAHNEGTEHNDE